MKLAKEVFGEVSQPHAISIYLKAKAHLYSKVDQAQTHTLYEKGMAILEQMDSFKIGPLKGKFYYLNGSAYLGEGQKKEAAVMFKKAKMIYQ